MAAFVSNGPYGGIKLLGREVGASSDDTVGISLTEDYCESARCRTTLLSKEEGLVTPAGSFEGCTLIESVISTSGEDPRLGPELERVRAFNAGTRQVWYAPGIGPVRLLYKHHNGYETDISLVEHDIRGAEDEYLPLAIDNRWRYRWQDPINGSAYEDSLRVASHKKGQWWIAFVTRATATEGGAGQPR